MSRKQFIFNLLPRTASQADNFADRYRSDLNKKASTFLAEGAYGEADLVAGGFTRTAIGSGKGVRYSLKNWFALLQEVLHA